MGYAVLVPRRETGTDWKLPQRATQTRTTQDQEQRHGGSVGSALQLHVFSIGLLPQRELVSQDVNHLRINVFQKENTHTVVLNTEVTAVAL